MAISYDKIIAQMKNELNSIGPDDSLDTMKAKLHSVQSLAGLITENDVEGKKAVEKPTANFSVEEAEAKAMGVQSNTATSQEKIDRGTRLNETDANGESLFDF